jgi:acyl dehydratase
MVTLDSPEAIRAFVGQCTTSNSLLVDQKMIDGFADLTNDHQWLHIDVDRAAKESPYGATIAHGLLTLSLLPAWYSQCLKFPNRRHAVNYGFDKVRFIGPVKSGSMVSGKFTLAKAEDVRPDDMRCTWEVEIRVDGVERPVLVAQWLIQVTH